MLDGSARANIVELLDLLTSEAEQQQQQLASSRDGLLGLLARDDEHVGVAHGALLIKLQAGSSRTRLLALQACDLLFRRFPTFRKLLCANFSGFLEQTVGFRPDRPLPPPLEDAEELRQQALETIERWRDQHGRECPQVVTGCRYLRDCLGMRLPELRARAAQRREQQAAQRQRTQQLLMERFRQLPEQLADVRQDARKLLALLRECEDLLLGREPAATAAAGEAEEDAAAAPVSTWAAEGGQRAALHPGSGPGPDADDEEWEDVPDFDPGRLADEDAGEGLAMYGASATLQGSSLPGLAADGSGAGVQPSLDEGTRQGLLDNMSDVCKRLAARCVSRLQSWLRMLAQLDLGGGGGGSGSGGSSGGGNAAVRDRLLRETLSLRNVVQDALVRAQALGAFVPETALLRTAAVAPAAAAQRTVNVVVSLTSGEVEEEDEDEDGDEGDDGAVDEESELDLDGATDAVGVGEFAGDGTATAGPVHVGAKRAREEEGPATRAAAAVAAAAGRGALGRQRQGRGAVGRPAVRGRGRGRGERPGQAGVAVAAAQQQLSYNDKVISGGRDEDVARRLQEELASQGLQQEQQAGGRKKGGAAAASKGKKLTGKALIQKRLGLLKK